MQYIDPYAAFAAVIYFFGVFLYYVHVKTIFYFLKKPDEMHFGKVIFSSLLWIFNVVMLMWVEFTGEDDDR
tara:strand:- start:1376 stop:1588 length:213 start_codon:yes stop_codon:yes gene_type:complete